MINFKQVAPNRWQKQLKRGMSEVAIEKHQGRFVVIKQRLSRNNKQNVMGRTTILPIRSDGWVELSGTEAWFNTYEAALKEAKNLMR